MTNPIIRRLFASTLTMLVWLSAEYSIGQHDPQRDASRLIAQGKLDQALGTLKKGDQSAAETHFVRMLIALRKQDQGAAVEHAKAALDAGLPFGRLVAGPRGLLQSLYETEAYRQWAAEHAGLSLVHGPMLGDVTESSVRVWLRTAKPAVVQVRATDPQGRQILSTKSQTTERADLATTVRIAGLQPNTRYTYQVLIDGKRHSADNTRFRTSPTRGQSAKFDVAFGGGAGYIPKWEYMWNTINKADPHIMLMLGDNVYIDAPKQSLTTKYCYYRRQSRPEWRRFVASTPIYAIYDDHDFGTNDCVPGPDIEKPMWKRKVWQTFQDNWCNPSYGGGTKQPGCWCDFYVGDVHFILLDGRYYRSRKEPASMLGPAQKRWLFETLKNSKGTFKVLASPVPWTAGIKPGSRDPWDGFPQEREEIFSYLEKQRINGVVLISADRHRTDLRITRRQRGYDLFEFESSRLTNRHTHKVVKTPGLVWGYNKTCSFAMMRFDTTTADPRVIFEARSIDGKRIHEYTLRLSRLTHGK